MSISFDAIKFYLKDLGHWLALVFVEWLKTGCGPLTTLVGLWQQFSGGVPAPFWWTALGFAVLAAFHVWRAGKTRQPKLEVFHTENHHQHQCVGDSGELTYRVGVREENGRQVNGVSVRLRLVELIKDIPGVDGAALRKQLEKLADVPLRLKHDDSPPYREVFDLPPESSRDVEVIQDSPWGDRWTVRPGHLRFKVFHATERRVPPDGSGDW